jgi:tetratricopeptide (TPR) repeat protein
MQDVLITYGEVARDVAKEANIPLTAEEDSRLSSINIVNPAAYQSYLIGMEYWERLTDANLDTALQFFELARKIDPEYALAYRGISRFWGGKMIGGYAPYSVAGPKAKAAADKALSLDSTLRFGGFYVWYFWDWETAEKLYLKSLELNPNNADVNRSYSHFLAIIGKPDEGIPYMEKALALDRLNPFFYGWYGMSLNYAHRYDEAIEVLEDALLKFPPEMIILSTLRSSYHQKQMYDEAIQAGIKYYEVRGDSICIAALEDGYREGGYHFALQRNAEALIEQSKTKYITPNQVATLYTRAGMKEEALDWLEKAYEEHDTNMAYLNADPIFDWLRDEPRFRELVKKMKYPE